MNRGFWWLCAVDAGNRKISGTKTGFPAYDFITSGQLNGTRSSNQCH